jgi:hypothetical protein
MDEKSVEEAFFKKLLLVHSINMASSKFILTRGNHWKFIRSVSQKHYSLDSSQIAGVTRLLHQLTACVTGAPTSALWTFPTLGETRKTTGLVVYRYLPTWSVYTLQEDIHTILVGGFKPSEKYEIQLGFLFPICGKYKMFQTTNQYSTIVLVLYHVLSIYTPYSLVMSSHHSL